MENNILILPCFALEPNKFSTFNKVFTSKHFTKDGIFVPKVYEKKTVTRSFHNFEISENAYRTLKRKINWLYYLAKSKHVKTYSGKDIFNFKMSFITLTLPAKQVHTTSYITNTLFNQFLTEIRQRFGVQNYVWRLEFQKNKNVHYHLVTDTFIDYNILLKIWNRVLLKVGYIEEYTNKFSKKTFSQYCRIVDHKSVADKNILAKRFQKGVLAKWKNPNSVDVKSVSSSKNIANYISKYFGKNADQSNNCNPLDNEENSKSLRLWFCSRSLSKLNSISDFCEAVVIDWFSVISNIKEVKDVSFRYARVFYYNFKDCVKFELELIHNALKGYALQAGYLPAT